MCEIAVADADLLTQDVEGFVEGCAESMYKKNPHGIGFVAVYPDAEDGTFAYDVAKAQYPDWEQITNWLRERSDAWRVIVHARLATAGGKGFEQTHPIYVPDEDCDANWVVHNGIVRRARSKREDLIADEDHEFNTTVDSEVIAHKYPDLPTDSLDEFEEADISGRLNWLLLGDEQILLRNSGKYIITEDFRVTCRNEWIEDSTDVGQEYALITPDKEMETTEASSAKYSYSGTGSGSAYRGTGRGGWSIYSGSSFNNDDDEEDDEGNGDQRRVTEYSEDTGDEGGNDPTIAHARYCPNERHVHRRYDSGMGYQLSMGTKVINNRSHLAIRVYDEETGAGVEDAVVSVYPGADSEYKDTGAFETDEEGEILLLWPAHGDVVHARLVEVPFSDEGYDDEDEADELTDPLDGDNARDVNWWWHYDDEVTYGDETGYCSMHHHEFTGDNCEFCLEEFDRRTLLSGTWDDLFDEYGTDAGEFNDIEYPHTD